MEKNLKLLNCKEFAELLGVKISTVYVWICKKQLPERIYRKLGRKPIFIQSEVESWILEGAQFIKKEA